MTTSRPPDLALALTPLHLAQAVCLAERGRGMTILAAHPEPWGALLTRAPHVRLVLLAERKRVIAEARRERRPFRAVHATPWLRPALQMEAAAIRAGGSIALIDDGIGNYRPLPPLTLGDRLRGLVHRLVDGRVAVPMPHYRARDPHVVYHALRPDASTMPMPALALDSQALREALGDLDVAFAPLLPHKGRPLFFDTNDADNGWLPFEAKVAILRPVLEAQLRDGPVLYAPHPSQKRRLTEAFPDLVDLTDRTHRWNELAAWWLRPERLISVFSSAILTLRWLGLRDLPHETLHERFFAATGNPIYRLEPRLAALLA